ncbi:MAG: hypothetical protein LBI92_00680 [Azoarcus sp.]|jgi:hypothetical protein|nr:hypothetical protein [Azoarcus sp.]
MSGSIADVVKARVRDSDVARENTLVQALVQRPKWGVVDLLRWFPFRERIDSEFLQLGMPYIQTFKNTWVVHNRHYILENAAKNQIRQELLAGVCWVEVGGDPNIADWGAFSARVFNQSLGSPLNGKNAWKIGELLTKPPENTSFGSVSMQVRTAADTVGRSFDDYSDQLRLAAILQVDVNNIEIVARHLRQLAEHDKFSPPYTKEQARIMATRYNRGVGRPLEKLLADKRSMSYGDFVVRFWENFGYLLSDAANLEYKKDGDFKNSDAKPALRWTPPVR